MRSKTALLCRIFLFVICTIGALPIYASASNQHTESEVRSWLDREITEKRQHGDGECVPFVNDYLTGFWGSPRPAIAVAQDWYCTEGWYEVDLGGSADNFRMGDVVVENWGDGVGHVAIYYGKENGKHYVVDQNSNYGTIKYPAKHEWRNPLHCYTKCFRHNILSEIRGSYMTVGFDRVLPDGDYIIASSANPLCYLDIMGAGTGNNNDNVHIWKASGLDAIENHDVWTISYSGGFYTIKQKGTNMYLDLLCSDTLQENNVQIYQNNYNDAQKWAIERNNSNGYRLRPKCSGSGTHPMCLDIQGGNISAGTNVWQWEINNSNAQSWLFIPYKPSQPIEEGRYILLYTTDASFELDVAGDTGDIPNNTNVQIWKSDVAGSQYNSFDFIPLQNGYYKVKNTTSWKCLSVKDGSTNYKSLIGVYDDNGHMSQQWAVVSNGAGFSLISRCNGYALDLPLGTTGNGNKVEVYPSLSNNHQRWSFVKAESKITFADLEAGNIPDTQTKYYKIPLTISKQIPIMDGYEFVCWEDSQNNQYNPGDLYTEDADLVLFPVWRQRVYDYTVTYDANGGANAPASQHVTAASMTLSDGEPTRNHFVFLGWSDSPDAVAPTYAPGAVYSGGDITLYAVWQRRLENVLALPNALTIIEDEAFINTNIDAVMIPASVVEIGEGAFSDVVIMGYPNTAAEAYAVDNGLTFINIEDD